MTKWVSMHPDRHVTHPCQCFHCLRRRGITRNVPDCLGRFHDRSDGTELIGQPTDEGVTITKGNNKATLNNS